jgi:hypothetical protein
MISALLHAENYRGAVKHASSAARAKNRVPTKAEKKKQ